MAPGSSQAMLQLACMEAPPKRNKKHPGGLLQITPEHYLISPTSSTPKGWSQQAQVTAGANPPLRGQPPHSSSYTVGVASPHSQSVWESIPPTDATKKIKAQLQQENTYNTHKGYCRNTHKRSGRLRHWTTENTYYRRLSGKG